MASKSKYVLTAERPSNGQIMTLYSGPSLIKAEAKMADSKSSTSYVNYKIETRGGPNFV